MLEVQGTSRRDLKASLSVRSRRATGCSTDCIMPWIVTVVSALADPAYRARRLGQRGQILWDWFTKHTWLVLLHVQEWKKCMWIDRGLLHSRTVETSGPAEIIGAEDQRFRKGTRES